MSFRETSYLNSVNRILRQHQMLAREASGAERVLRSLGGMDQVARFANSRSSIAVNAARLAETVNPVGANRAAYYADIAKRIVPESMRPGFQFAELSRNLAGVSHYSRLQSDALKFGNMFGNSGLSGIVAQASKLHGIASARSSPWNEHRVQSFRAPALKSLLKSMTTIGPVVISPDDEDVPLDYHPDLQGWLLPETATTPREAVDVEQLWADMVAIARRIARDHRTEALVRGLGNDGRTLLIQVTSTVIGTLIVYWFTQR